MKLPVLAAPKNLHWAAALAVLWILQWTLVPAIDPYVFTIIMYAGINVVLAVSLNLVNGFTGQFSMGHAGFMSVGAYLSAFFTTTLQASQPGLFEGPMAGVVLVAAILLGGLASAAAGWLVGLPSLRLKGDYLAIVTLGFGEIIRVIILNIEAVGGARGLPNIPGIASFGWVYSCVVVTLFVVWRLVASPLGRSLMSVREDEIAAEAMGVNTTEAKVRAFVTGAFFAGVGGALFGHYLRYLNPAAFDFNRSFEYIIMVVLGGMGSITGSAVAAVLLTALKEALRPLQEITKLDFRMIIYSLLLIILMLTKPNGLFGTRELPEILGRWKKRLRPAAHGGSKGVA